MIFPSPIIFTSAQQDALATLIDRELSKRLKERVSDPDYSTPSEVARAFINLDVPRIELKAFRLIELDEEVISDAVYEACGYGTVKGMAGEMMDGW